jgi:hypothetical protein
MAEDLDAGYLTGMPAGLRAGLERVAGLGAIVFLWQKTRPPSSRPGSADRAVWGDVNAPSPPLSALLG